MPNKPLIELHALQKSYTLAEQTVQVLHEVNLEVQRGEMLAILGASGSGKSTLMNIIGLLDNADSGRYLLDGEEVTLLSEDEQAQRRNRQIGFVFQQFNLLPRLSASHNVALPLHYRHLKADDVRENVYHSLCKVGMEKYSHHLPSQLSGGQQQRVAIARALVVRPAVILADEPTGALDSENGREVVRLLRHCVAGGQTVIVVTHDLQVARQTDRLLLMQDGVLVAEKTAGELERFGGFEDQRHVAPDMRREVVSPQPRLDSSE